MMRMLPVLLAAILFFAVPASAGPRASVDQVRDVAFHYGIALIKDVNLDDGVQEVVGFDSYGTKIKIRVDASSGAIIKIKRKR